MAAGVKEVTIQPTLINEANPTTGLTQAPQVEDHFVRLVERLATDPAVDVAKLEKLVDIQRQIMADNARAEFDAAFVLMQRDLPIVDEKGRIIVDGQVRSKFAQHEDISEVVRPILGRHGFGLRHQNDMLDDGRLKITAILSHRNGHREMDWFICPADASGKKNNIQAMGSTREYGRRYTTLSILNIVTRGADDDGKKSGEPEAPPAPDGYEPWLAVLDGVADTGDPKAFAKAWNDSAETFRNYLASTAPGILKAMKKRAGLKV